jgi:hypothetical protein
MGPSFTHGFAVAEGPEPDQNQGPALGGQGSRLNSPLGAPPSAEVNKARVYLVAALPESDCS